MECSRYMFLNLVQSNNTQAPALLVWGFIPSLKSKYSYPKIVNTRGWHLCFRRIKIFIFQYAYYKQLRSKQLAVQTLSQYQINISCTQNISISRDFYVTFLKVLKKNMCFLDF
jgi:hypothetical protein